MRLEFLGAVYNEEQEIADLIAHVAPYVDQLNFCDDESTDQTVSIIEEYAHFYPIEYKEIAHTGLPETVKNEALSLVSDGSWVLMLDADERFAPGVLNEIKIFLSIPHGEVDYVYFRQIEMLDGRAVREFQKAKLFKKESIRFSTGIHEDDQFVGRGISNLDWLIYHRKSTIKQVIREREYIETYKKLLYEGKIDEGRYEWLRNLHYFIKD